MRKAVLVYNPVAGTGKMVQYLDEAMRILQKKQILALPLRTPLPENMLLSLLAEGIDYVLAAGGDGTIHQVVNALARHPSPPPLVVLPAGTSNDLAHNLGLPPLEAVLPMLDLLQPMTLDIGLAGNRYFINAATGGLLTDIGYKVDQRLKNNLGRIAYYLQGLADLPTFRTFPAEIVVDGKTVYSGEIFLFLIVNGRTVGSFKDLAPHASPTDGLLDLLVFKRCSLPDFFQLALKVLAGKHLDDPNLLYLQGSTFVLAGGGDIPTDLDGEKGAPLPWYVQICHKKLTVLASVKS
ncbi:MAG: YegS/Rv2252/BmrU family lipid kinase [Firmicutes bacterium]|jgi:YegS/Rv2252/BmrU family lipid kinase|nr:YegS/Rv2252/BmrU family lipid kinase [Bacillota bacterium]